MVFLENQRDHQTTTHLRVLRGDLAKLMSIKNGAGFKSLGWVIHSLLEQQARSVATVGAVMDGNVPIVLTGRPLSGKTSFIRQKLLPAMIGNPILVVDSWDEYTELRNISYDIYGIDFKNFSEQIRFVPSSMSRIAETELESIFSHLEMKRNEMARWTIVVEEAHTFKNVPAFAKFLYGSRHVVRKMIAVTPQTDAFEGLEVLTVYGK